MLNQSSGTAKEGRVQCVCWAISSLKTRAIPPFYKIIANIKTTELVYELVSTRNGLL